jgi:tRNA 2-selenouridine synthase
MSPPPRIEFDALHHFDTVIDVRSPAEFAQDHLPGAINCPVLDDEERRVVGTMYKQQGAFEAKRLGAALVSANIARHLQTRFQDRPPGWKPLVYCWRGGMRSGSLVTVMRMVGWNAQQLNGGYKRWRAHVVQQLDALCPQLPLRVLCGPTGSGKTRLLHRLREAGAQVLDLEALACHKGSALGALPGRAQPSQKAFETALCLALETLDLTRAVYTEAESRLIGRLRLPAALVERLRDSPCIELHAPLEARIDWLLQDYPHLSQPTEGATQATPALSPLLDKLRPQRGHDTVNRWQALAREASPQALRTLVGELLTQHYDPHYARSQRSHFRQWEGRQPLQLATCLDPTVYQTWVRALTENQAKR